METHVRNPIWEESVIRPGDAPLRADAQRNRTRILAAAESVSSEQGAAGTTEDVARRAQVAAYNSVVEERG